MINLPPQLTPSELLCREELASFIDELLQGASSRRREGRLPEAAHCVMDAIEAGQVQDANASQAVALIHLADVSREMGKLGPALAACQKAHPIFQRHSSRCQRHNEAVAAYALGLAHQLLGNEMDALKWYQKSGQLFERVKEDWATVNALTQVEICTRIQRWTETLSAYLTAARTRADGYLTTRIWVPVISSGADGDEFAIAELEIERYTVGNDLEVNGKPFRLQRLKGPQRVSMMPSARYDALEIPDDVRELWEEVGEDDYALVVWGEKADREGFGVLKTLAGPTFGKFERDQDGTINFIRTDATIIGGADIGEDLQVGYVTALLKPASPSEEPSAPPEEPATPPPGPSSTSAELYNRLISMVSGDKEAANRLIEYEHDRAPGASLPELVERAIARLIRDRK